MFDTLCDAAVAEAIATASREQNAACGLEMQAIGELYARRAPADEDERDNWAIDGHANVVAEISAALNISRGRAAGRLNYAIDLRERLPGVAAVFAAGDIDFRMMTALVSRSQNVEDPGRLARLDEAFAQWAPKWMKLSGPKLTERIDMWVEKFDPAGVREPQPPTDDRYVDVGPISPGMVGVWAKLAFVDGVAFDTRLDEMAATVCDDDPRTKRQRRADALMALAAGQSALECGCGAEDCASACRQREQPPLSQLVINVIADQATIDGRSESPGYLPGFGAVPSTMLRDLAAAARLQPVRLPEPCAEQGYRPSAALARFVRCRDLTCRFPGCDEPAAACQIDHTVPLPRRADTSVESQTAVRVSPSAEDVLVRSRRVVRPSSRRRHGRVDGAQWADLHHHSRWCGVLRTARTTHRRGRAGPADAWTGRQSSRGDDADASTHPRRGQGLPHRSGATTQRRAHPSHPTPARREALPGRRTTAVLTCRHS